MSHRIICPWVYLTYLRHAITGCAVDPAWIGVHFAAQAARSHEMHRHPRDGGRPALALPPAPACSDIAFFSCQAAGGWQCFQKIDVVSPSILPVCPATIFAGTGSAKRAVKAQAAPLPAKRPNRRPRSGARNTSVAG